MTLAVVDSSIVVKWIIGEDNSDAAVRLRSFYTFAAPDLVMAETANAILTKVKRGQVTEPEAMAAAELLSQVNLELHPMQSLVEDAVELGLRLRHPAYDCMFLALASRLGCPFITEDGAIRTKASTVPIQILSMTEAIALKSGTT